MLLSVLMRIEQEPRIASNRSDVEQHLRDALAHIAVAEALVLIDRDEDLSSVQALTTQIIARTVAIEAANGTLDSTIGQASVSNGSDKDFTSVIGNGKKQTTAVTNRSGQSTAPFTASKSNGTEVDISDSLHQDEQTKVNGLSGEVHGSQHDSSNTLVNDVDIAQHEELVKPTIELTAQEADYVGAIKERLNLSDRQVSMLEAIISQAPRGEWFKSGQIDFSVLEFSSPDALRNAKGRLFLLLRDHTLIHNGEEKGKSRYMLNPSHIQSIGTVSEEPVQRSGTEQQDSQDMKDDEGHKTKVVAEAVERKFSDEPPEVKYQGDIVNNRRDRRNDIITIDNLDELNEWIAGQNPYGSLSKISIETPRKLMVNGISFGLSDEQRELLNILLANYGKPLTQAEIMSMGFADVLGLGARLKAFSGIADRFLTSKVDDEGNRLMLGNKLSARGFVLNPVFQIVDNRESVKKN